MGPKTREFNVFILIKSQIGFKMNKKGPQKQNWNIFVQKTLKWALKQGIST